MRALCTHPLVIVNGCMCFLLFPSAQVFICLSMEVLVKPVKTNKSSKIDHKREGS